MRVQEKSKHGEKQVGMNTKKRGWGEWAMGPRGTKKVW